MWVQILISILSVMNCDYAGIRFYITDSAVGPTVQYITPLLPNLLNNKTFDLDISLRDSSKKGNHGAFSFYSNITHLNLHTIDLNQTTVTAKVIANEVLDLKLNGINAYVLVGYDTKGMLLTDKGDIELLLQLDALEALTEFTLNEEKIPQIDLQMLSANVEEIKYFVNTESWTLSGLNLLRGIVDEALMVAINNLLPYFKQYVTNLINEELVEVFPNLHYIEYLLFQLDITPQEFSVVKGDPSYIEFSLNGTLSDILHPTKDLPYEPSQLPDYVTSDKCEVRLQISEYTINDLVWEVMAYRLIPKLSLTKEIIDKVSPFPIPFNSDWLDPIMPGAVDVFGHDAEARIDVLVLSPPYLDIAKDSVSTSFSANMTILFQPKGEDFQPQDEEFQAAVVLPFNITIALQLSSFSNSTATYVHIGVASIEMPDIKCGFVHVNITCTSDLGEFLSQIAAMMGPSIQIDQAVPEVKFQHSELKAGDKVLEVGLTPTNSKEDDQSINDPDFQNLYF